MQSESETRKEEGGGARKEAKWRRRGRRLRRLGEWVEACRPSIELCSTSLGERGGVWTGPTLPRRLAPLRPLSTYRPPALIAPEQDAARHPRPLAASPLPPAPKRPRRVRVRVEVGRQGTPRPDHGRPVVQRDVPLGRQEGQASHGQRQDPRTRLRRLALEGEPSSSPLRMLLLLLSRELTPARARASASRPRTRSTSPFAEATSICGRAPSRLRSSSSAHRRRPSRGRQRLLQQQTQRHEGLSRRGQ